MPFKTFQISDGISLVQETGVANFLRCNIWHVKGRDFDLVIDTGMGLGRLKNWVMRDTEKPIKAIVTHCHFDHAGSLHEFDCRLGHKSESHILAAPTNQAVCFAGNWAEIEIIDPKAHPDHSAQTYHITPAPLTGYLDEGDVVDLGDRAFQVLHLPGHSPGSIGLWDIKAKTLFSGDAVYDGELLDTVYHSDRAVYRQTLHRLQHLDVDVFHGGHYPSFGHDRLMALTQDYLAGQNAITDILDWYNSEQAKSANIYGDQDWSAAKYV